jgi:hypothetical protein
MKYHWETGKVIRIVLKPENLPIFLHRKALRVIGGVSSVYNSVLLVFWNLLTLKVGTYHTVKRFYSAQDRLKIHRKDVLFSGTLGGHITLKNAWKKLKQLA